MHARWWNEKAGFQGLAPFGTGSRSKEVPKAIQKNASARAQSEAPGGGKPAAPGSTCCIDPGGLVAPYCAIPRDYLSDTPLLRAMGFLAPQHGQLGAIPPPFSERFPLCKACEVEVRYPPLKRGISAILARYPMKTRKKRAIPPSAILSRKGIARYGRVSRAGPLSQGVFP